MEQLNNPPKAASLMLTARSFGNYDLAGALADLIDNSIKAGAKKLEIDCQRGEDQDCRVRIRDDGYGMSRDELVAAMRPASTNPESDRSEDDLGRFGWGLKSASFSQCRKLTVVTKKGEELYAARWDLDDIDDWKMMLWAGKDAEDFLEAGFQTNSGTEIIWENCDRLTEQRSLTSDQFNSVLSEARQKLSLIFHRYLSGDSGKCAKLQIALNNTPLDQNDPFCTLNNATIICPEEPIKIRHEGADSTIKMQAFILPHYSKLTAREHEDYAGREGYLRNQGFYVYRNRRLIISGTWFGLAKHGELSKLVRVRIDIPNNLDDMWKITVDKSDAQLPSALKRRMKELVSSFRNQSHKVIRSKGARLDATEATPVWTRRSRQGRVRYEINRKHPLLAAVLDSLPGQKSEALTALIAMVEAQIPVDSINHEVSSDPLSIDQNFGDRSAVETIIRQSIPQLMVRAGTPERLREILAETEPYASNMLIVSEILGGLLD